MSISLYARNYTDEFPHQVEVLERKLVSSSYEKGDVYEWHVINSFKTFMDTPTSSEQLRFHQMDLQFNKTMYLPYGIFIDHKHRIKYEDTLFEVVGDLEDQGGQHEINRLMIRRLPNGTY